MAWYLLVGDWDLVVCGCQWSLRVSKYDLLTWGELGRAARDVLCNVLDSLHGSLSYSRLLDR